MVSIYQMILVLSVATVVPAAAHDCANPEALGTSRTVAIGDAPELGLKSYPQTLALDDHEVVLTFDDGPAPTGQRFCNNGVALSFVPDGEPLPPLRG